MGGEWKLGGGDGDASAWHVAGMLTVLGRGQIVQVMSEDGQHVCVHHLTLTSSLPTLGQPHDFREQQNVMKVSLPFESLF